jgi:hypothetical protein
VHAAGRAEVVEGDLAGGGHGLHFPRRGLHPLLVARVYEPGGRLGLQGTREAGWLAKLRKGWWLQGRREREPGARRVGVAGYL